MTLPIARDVRFSGMPNDPLIATENDFIHALPSMAERDAWTEFFISGVETHLFSQLVTGVKNHP